MKPRHFIAGFVCLLVCGHAQAQTQSIDDGLSSLTTNLVSQLTDHGKKKVAVIDFTDLQGGSSELGRYIAEEMTLNLVASKRDFAVLDRANLKSILAEHQLTSKGLVDPDNAKKLGQFAGVDTIVLGTIVPLGQTIKLTAKAITTDTAEIVAASRVTFKSDDTVQQLLSQAASGPPGSGSDPQKEQPKVVKSFGDLRVEMPPLRIVNGSEYVLTMVLTNTSRKSVWIAVSTDMGSNVRGVLVAADGTECGSNWNLISGLVFAASQNGGFFRATEVPAHEAITATMKFGSRRQANEGACHLQLELLIGHDFNGSFGAASVQTLAADLKAN